MKAFFTVPIALAAVAAAMLVSQQLPGAEGSPSPAASPATLAEGNATGKIHWYLVDQNQGQDLAGQSSLDPDQVAAALAAGQYFALSDYRVMDANGQWSPAKSERIVGTIYIQPTLVRSFQLLTGDPLLWSPPGTGDDG